MEPIRSPASACLIALNVLRFISGLQLRQHLKKGHPFPENDLAPCTSKRNDEGHLFLLSKRGSESHTGKLCGITVFKVFHLVIVNAFD